MFYCLGSSGLSFYSILILIRIELIKIRLWASCYDRYVSVFSGHFFATLRVVVLALF